MVLGKWIFTCKIIKLDTYLTPFTKINSKCIKDLIVRSETVKLEKTQGKISLIVVWELTFLDVTPKAQEMKAKINKWVYNLSQSPRAL